MSMTIRWVVVAALFMTSLFFLHNEPSMVAVTGQYQFVIAEGDEPVLSARAWGIFDRTTGEMIGGSMTSAPYPIASVTKLMTAHLVLDAEDVFATATVSWRATATEGRAGKLAAGEEMQFRELLFPLLLESSNDAAEAIVEHVGEGAIDEMNAHAREIGMHTTTFRDASGLSAGNISTVEDLTAFALHIDRTHRHIFDITELQKYIGEEHTWWNSNLIASEKGFSGGKNGYTEEAGRTLLAFFEQPLSGGVTRDVGIVILGSEDLAADLSALRSYLEERVSYEYVE